MTALVVIDGGKQACLICEMKTRVAALIFALAIAFMAAPLQAEDAPCCATGKTAKKAMCEDYAKLNLSPDQKTRLTALQEKCEKAGCTEESRAKFLKSAQREFSQRINTRN